MNDTERVDLRLPAVRIERPRERRRVVIPFAPREVDFKDRHRLARFRLGQQLVVVISPPRRDAGAEDLAVEIRVFARARHDVDDTALDHLVCLSSLHYLLTYVNSLTKTFSRPP